MFVCLSVRLFVLIRYCIKTAYYL